MANDIVQHSSDDSNNFDGREFLKQLASEIKVDAQGNGSISRKGLARLLNTNVMRVSRAASSLERGVTENLSRPLQKYTGYSLEGVTGIPDFIASAIIRDFDLKGVKNAQILVDLFLEKSLQDLFKEVTNWKPQSHPFPNQLEPGWERQRYLNRQNFPNFTDAIKFAIENPEVEISVNGKKWAYSNACNALAIAVVGCSVKKYCTDRGIKKEDFRNSLDLRELKLLEMLENIAGNLMMKRNMTPKEAIAEAIDRAII